MCYGEGVKWITNNLKQYQKITKIAFKYVLRAQDMDNIEY